MRSFIYFLSFSISSFKAKICLIFAIPNIHHIPIAINTNFPKFLYLSTSSNTKNQFFIFHKMRPITVQIKTLFMINFRFRENLFSLYNSWKLRSHNVIYPVHNARTHQYIQIHFMAIKVTNEITSAIHINFTLSLIFPIQANTPKLNQAKVENNVNITPYDNNTPENANLVHNSMYPVSFHRGIKKLINNITAIAR